jgi:hypothetical protein
MGCHNSIPYQEDIFSSIREHIKNSTLLSLCPLRDGHFAQVGKPAHASVLLCGSFSVNMPYFTVAKTDLTSTSAIFGVKKPA